MSKKTRIFFFYFCLFTNLIIFLTFNFSHPVNRKEMLVFHSHPTKKKVNKETELGNEK